MSYDLAALALLALVPSKGSALDPHEGLVLDAGAAQVFSDALMESGWFHDRVMWFVNKKGLPRRASWVWGPGPVACIEFAELVKEPTPGFVFACLTCLLFGGWSNISWTVPRNNSISLILNGQLIASEGEVSIQRTSEQEVHTVGRGYVGSTRGFSQCEVRVTNAFALPGSPWDRDFLEQEVAELTVIASDLAVRVRGFVKTYVQHFDPSRTGAMRFNLHFVGQEIA